MNILITGGCGYIGSATARFLRSEGHDIVVVDDLSEGHREAWDGAHHCFNLRDRDALDTLAKNHSFDGVIHFAARAYVGESVQQPVRYWAANVIPVVHVCESFPGLPFVFSSTCATYGDPQTPTLAEDHPQNPVNPYGRTKLTSEAVLQDRHAAKDGSFAALRYFNAAGADRDGRHGEDHRPETHLLPLAILAALGRDGPLTVFGDDWDTPDGTCIRDYIHVEDLARAHGSALQRLVAGGASGAWNLGTGSGSSVREVLAAVEAAVGQEVPFALGSRRSGDPARLVADPRRARSDLSWDVQFPNLEGIVETAARWHRDHPEGYG